MRAFLIGVAIVTTPGVALPQTAQTYCQPTGEMTSCNTYYQPRPTGGGALAGFAQGFTQSVQRTQDEEGGNASRSESIWTRLHRDHVRREVGGLVADGKCPEARARALRDGDFDLAQKVSTMCAESVGQPKP